MKTSFFSELSARFSAESPKFFKQLQNWGLSFAALGLGLLAIHGLPKQLYDVAGYFVTIGAVIKVVAALPVCNPEDIKSKPDHIQIP